MKIVITTTDGIQIMSLVQDSNLSEALRKWGDLHPNKYISHREMPEEAIPLDRTFRDAWADTTPELTIDIDMAKARSIHLERIRIKRNTELSKLDIQATKAQDIGDTETLTQIRVRKQELRDLPSTLASTIASAVSVDALKAIQPLE
jgi:multidrug efflux pump subunit AcrB|tara:strand:- start:2276 stop:2716 length:441 start_codon:yes stop_codon:yes gene_type:complete